MLFQEHNVVEMVDSYKHTYMHILHIWMYIYMKYEDIHFPPKILQIFLSFLQTSASINCTKELSLLLYLGIFVHHRVHWLPQFTKLKKKKNSLLENANGIGILCSTSTRCYKRLTPKLIFIYHWNKLYIRHWLCQKHISLVLIH